MPGVKRTVFYISFSFLFWFCRLGNIFLILFYFLFLMVLPAGKFENPLTCPNIDIGALELTWRGCAISTKDKNIVQRYGITSLCPKS